LGVFPVRFVEGRARRADTTAPTRVGERTGAYVISTAPAGRSAPGVTLSLYLPRRGGNRVNASGLVRTVGARRSPPAGIWESTSTGTIAEDGLVRIRKGGSQLAQSTGAPKTCARSRGRRSSWTRADHPRPKRHGRDAHSGDTSSPAGMFIEMEKIPAFAAVFPGCWFPLPRTDSRRSW